LRTTTPAPEGTTKAHKTIVIPNKPGSEFIISPPVTAPSPLLNIARPAKTVKKKGTLVMDRTKMLEMMDKMYPDLDIDSLFDEKGDLVLTKVLEREDRLLPGIKLSKVFDANGKLDSKLVEDFKAEVRPIIPGVKDMLDETGKIDKQKVFRQIKLVEAQSNGSFDLSSLMDEEGHVDKFRLHLLKEKVEMINKDSDDQFNGLQEQSLRNLMETKTQYEQSKAQFDGSKADYEKYFNETKAQFSLTETEYKTRLEETKSQFEVNKAEFAERLKEFKAQFEDTKMGYEKQLNESKAKVGETKKYFQQFFNKTKADYKNLNLSDVLGISVDPESEAELRKGNLKKFLEKRPDILGAALPADDCFTKAEEEGQCMTEAECIAAGGTSGGSCHRGFDYSPYPRTCCVYKYQCDADTDKQTFYYQSPDYPKPPRSKANCSMKIKVLPGVCQVRLDFLDFKMGRIMEDGQCPEEDRLQIRTNVKNSRLPLQHLCGTLTSDKNPDQHVYIHIGQDEADQERTISLDSSITNFRSTLNIQVTQITCNGAPLQAPAGCAQYFLDDKGSISSLNFPDGQYQSQLDMTTCIKPDESACGIRFHVSTLYIGGNTAATGRINYGLKCSDYIAFMGEITGMCGYAADLDVTLPLFGYQGFTFRSDQDTKKYEAGFLMDYKYVHSCSEEKFYQYPK